MGGKEKKNISGRNQQKLVDLRKEIEIIIISKNMKLKTKSYKKN